MNINQLAKCRKILLPATKSISDIIFYVVVSEIEKKWSTKTINSYTPVPADEFHKLRLLRQYYLYYGLA